MAEIVDGFIHTVTFQDERYFDSSLYSCTYGDFTNAGDASGLTKWNNYWSDIWFLVAQAMTWYYEYGIIIDYTTDKEGFLEQASEEFVAAMKLYHKTYGQSSWITDWDSIGTHSIIDSSDGGVTGNSAYVYISTGINSVLNHPEYYHEYHLWEYEWDRSQPWKLVGHSSTEMQRFLIAVPGPDRNEGTLQLQVKKLEAGTNNPIPGVTFKIESVSSMFPHPTCWTPTTAAPSGSMPPRGRTWWWTL